MSAVLLLTAPCVFGMALASTPLQFIMLRFGIGFALSAFVTCQFWSSCMFSTRIVGARTACCLRSLLFAGCSMTVGEPTTLSQRKLALFRAV